jgi:hypothetical protein
MGTDRVSLLLYSLVVMLRPRSVLEIGSGYSTLFLARAVADAALDAQQDRRALAADSPESAASRILSEGALKEYTPHLFTIDSLRHPRTSAGLVPGALDRLGLSGVATVLNGGFAGASRRLPSTAMPLDFIWFDCGASDEAGVEFVNEYWPLVNADGGLVALHSMQLPLRGVLSARGKVRIPSPLLNELGKQQADLGRRRAFELLTLVEPHKLLQGDVAIIRKTGPLSRIRDRAFNEDAKAVVGRNLGGLIAL